MSGSTASCILSQPDNAEHSRSEKEINELIYGGYGACVGQYEFRRANVSFSRKNDNMTLFRIVFSLILVGTPQLMRQADGLLRWNNDESSVCRVVTSHKESRYVPYRETYRTRFRWIKMRVNYRIEFVTVWTTTEKCCDGYILVDGVRCEPFCDNPCENGVCVEPNTCECHSGYGKSGDPEKDHICEPKCSYPCVNGTCSQPEVCTCEPDYWLDSDGFTCVPTCNEDCEKGHGYCSAPNVCSCHPGYRKIGSDVCEPICDRACVNAVCMAPNICSCNDGYETDPEDVFRCNPKCMQECLFGVCKEPNVCVCNSGYSLNNESVCEPVCSEPCENGKCVAPEICSCDDGYGLTESSKYVCEPICSTPCIDGVCSAPDVCTCKERFFMVSTNEGHVCMPVCEVPCHPFGVCVGPDVCACDAGYQQYTLKHTNITGQHPEDLEKPSSACEPLCEPECINGTCTSPGVCTCNSNHTLSPDASNVCVPVCRTPCGANSTCTSPDVCTCNEGYQRNTKDESKCDPICKIPCENGVCTAPGVCTCNEGYEKLGNTCHPSCYPPCVNGTCVNPNVCECEDGFILQDKRICKPHCESGCSNGDCVSPNECICHSGFVRDGNSSECVRACARNCSGHGFCLSEEVACECVFGWSGWDCDQPTVCVVSLQFGDANAQRVVPKETNTSLVEIYEGTRQCYQCIDFLDNDTLCYVMYSDYANESIVCFISTELPCYGSQLTYKAVTGVSKMAGPLSAVTIILLMLGVTVVYFTIRRHQKRKKATAINPGNSILQDRIGTESLLSEDAVYL